MINLFNQSINYIFWKLDEFSMKIKYRIVIEEMSSTLHMTIIDLVLLPSISQTPEENRKWDFRIVAKCRGNC